MTGVRNPELRSPLLTTRQDEIDGDVEQKGTNHPKSSSGGWRSASFILGGGILERFAFYGVESNLITFLTGPVEESVATAASQVNTWMGVVSLVPIMGALLADSCVGRYRSIVIFSFLYIMGIGLLTLSATIISPKSISGSQASSESGPQAQPGILFFVLVSLYVVALAQGHKVCIQAFGADQFDGNHQLPSKKSRAKSSFFNWWIFGTNSGSVLAHLILPYIQENISWGIGFGIPCLAMIVGLVLFLLGTAMYRFPAAEVDGDDDESSYETISQRHHQSLNSSIPGEEDAAMIDGQKFQRYRFPVSNVYSKKSNQKTQKTVLKVLPIWITCLTYTIALAQVPTLFTKQAATVNRSIGKNLNVPVAMLKTFIPVAISIFMAIYDRIFVPVAARVTGYPSGITTLQRVGTGLVLSILNMIIAALVEMKRLKTARYHGLIDIPDATVPMSFWWLIPPYTMVGIALVFTGTGMQEFLYDQVPKELKSVGLSFHNGVLGIGSFLSGFLVFFIDKITSQNGKDSWFSSNLNRAHLDYFYWMLAGIGAIGFTVFVHLSKSYNYLEEQNDFQECEQEEKNQHALTSSEPST